MSSENNPTLSVDEKRSKLLAYHVGDERHIQGLTDKQVVNVWSSVGELVEHALDEKRRLAEGRAALQAELRHRYRPAPVGFVWVCMYEVVLAYGGPEEGGWWYDAWECVEARCVSYRRARRVIAKMKREAAQSSQGDYRSVCPGEKYVVTVTHNRAADETQSRPQYC